MWSELVGLGRRDWALRPGQELEGRAAQALWPLAVEGLREKRL